MTTRMGNQGDQSVPPCVIVFGGSFDPVHFGHVALAKHFIDLLAPQVLRIIPTGNPWQKSGLVASAEQRCKMLELAFYDEFECHVVIDKQEIRRAQQQRASYTVETLRELRREYGPEVSLVFLIGADQLLNLSSWHQWQSLFELAHICAASRPGFQLSQMNSGKTQQVAEKFKQGAATPEQIRTTPAGLTYLADDLFIDISATEIREDLSCAQNHHQIPQLIPSKVFDYLRQHQIYENNGY